MKILVTGGCGYIGNALIPKLLDKGHKVISVDKQYFGNKLRPHKNLINLKLCVSDIKKDLLNGVNTVIHLAAISNDPAALLNSKITWETNVLYTLNLLNACKNKKIKQFIFASSGSVYGVSKKKKVDEKTDLLPISDYNKTKMIGEKLITSFKKYFNVIILRPGTVCGYAKSLRLDLTVNAMTFSALRNGVINVNGGNQIRPQVHIEDMVNAYLFFLKFKKSSGIYNVGFENFTIMQIAKMIKKKIASAKIKINQTNDPRSYRLYSKKILNIGFKTKNSTSSAISDFIKYYKLKKITYKKNFYRALYLKEYLQKKAK